MATKQIIERNLSLTSKYKMISISRSNLFEVETVMLCENCNASLVNFATIQNETGKSFIVGLDCMKTLTQALTNLPEFEYQLYAFNSALRFYALMQNAEKIRIRNGFIFIEYTDKKGVKHTKQDFEQVYRDFNFDLSKFDITETANELKMLEILSHLENGKSYQFEKRPGEVYRLKRENGKTRLYCNETIMRHLDIEQTERMILAHLDSK